MRINVTFGTLGSVYLPHFGGLCYFGLAFPNEGAVLAVLAIAAGILLLVGK